MLFVVWTGQSYRPTMDLDLLGYGEDSSERVEEMFRNVCCVGVEPDGLLFDPEMVKSAPIREDQDSNRYAAGAHGGVRARCHKGCSVESIRTEE